MEKENTLSRSGFTCIACGIKKDKLDEHGMQISIMSTWNNDGLSGYICSDCIQKEPFKAVSILVSDKLQVYKEKNNV